MSSGFCCKHHDLQCIFRNFKALGRRYYHCVYRNQCILVLLYATGCLLSFELQIDLPCFRILLEYLHVYQIIVVTILCCFFTNNVSLLHWSVIKKIAQYIGEVMEDSKDKVQENLLANGGRCCEWGYLNALMLLIIASRCEHLELKHSHIRKDNNQEYFLRTLSGQIPFFYFSKFYPVPALLPAAGTGRAKKETSSFIPKMAKHLFVAFMDRITSRQLNCILYSSTASMSILLSLSQCWDRSRALLTMDFWHHRWMFEALAPKHDTLHLLGS